MEEQPSEEPKSEQPTDKAARVQQWVKEMEGKVRDRLKDVEQTIRTEYRGAVPHDVSAHLQKSKEEFLLAVRSIVDRQIEKARRQSPKPQDTAGEQKPTDQQADKE